MAEATGADPIELRLFRLLSRRGASFVHIGLRLIAPYRHLLQYVALGLIGAGETVFRLGWDGRIIEPVGHTPCLKDEVNGIEPTTRNSKRLKRPMD